MNQVNYPDWLPAVTAKAKLKPATFVEMFDDFLIELKEIGTDNSEQAMQRILIEFPELDKAQANELIGLFLRKTGKI